MAEKVIVFGGSGFLGSYVADALTHTGYKVAIYDAVPSEYAMAEQDMIVGDILDEGKVNTAVKDCEIVYNFAGMSDIEKAKDNPLQTIKDNVLGNTIILESARKNKVRRFLFASTIYVYSKAGSFYRSSKQACELIIETYQKTYGLDYTILRYGSLYGPRANEHNWIANILKEAVKEGKITRYGDGEEIREYIHVEDAARCSVEVLSEEFKNENVIITGHQQIKIKDLLAMIKEMMDNKIDIEYAPVDEASSHNDPALHYSITPYSFRPRIAKKLISHHYLDLGQGLLSCLHDAYERYRS